MVQNWYTLYGTQNTTHNYTELILETVTLYRIVENMQKCTADFLFTLIYRIGFKKGLKISEIY